MGNTCSSSIKKGWINQPEVEEGRGKREGLQRFAESERGYSSAFFYEVAGEATLGSEPLQGTE